MYSTRISANSNSILKKTLKKKWRRLRKGYSNSTPHNVQSNFQPSHASLKDLELGLTSSFPKDKSKDLKKAKLEEEEQKKKKTKVEEEAPKKKFRPIRAVRIPNEKPPPHDPDYLHHLPEILQPYVSKVLDVESDGHCGFQVVSYCLGRGQHDHLAVRNKIYEDTKERGKWYKDNNYITNLPSVLKRIKVDSSGPCVMSNWMSMPTAGDLIANTFKAPVFFWSTSYSQTFFPHFFPPNDNPPIFIAFLSSFRHFVVVEPQNPFLFPAPQVLKQWLQTADPDALAWGEKFVGTCR